MRMMMLFILQFILIFQGALSAEENSDTSTKNETAVATDPLRSRSDAFKPSFQFELNTNNDAQPEPKPTENIQDRDWSGNQYKFQESDSLDFNYDQTKTLETTATTPQKTYQETPWSKPYEFDSAKTSDSYYQQNEDPYYEYDSNKPTTNEEYYNKPYSYDESKPLGNDQDYYGKQFSYKESKPSSGSDDEFYEYKESKPLSTGEEYFGKKSVYEESKASSGSDDYFGKKLSSSGDFYSKPFSYKENKPDSDDYFGKQFSYGESKPSSGDDDYYVKPMSYGESKPLSNEEYYDKPFDAGKGEYLDSSKDEYYDGKPFDGSEYYDKPFESSKTEYHNKPFDGSTSGYYDKPFESGKTEYFNGNKGEYYDKPFDGDKGEYYDYDKTASYEDGKLVDEGYYTKPFSFGKTKQQPSFRNPYSFEQPSKLLEFNEKIPMIKPFVMENSQRDYIPLKMIEDYSQKESPMKLAGTHVSIPPFKLMKGGGKGMYSPIVLGDDKTSEKILEATKSSIQTLQQSIKENMPFALPFTFEQGGKKGVNDGKGGGENGYYFKFEDKRPNSPKLKDSYNYKLKEELPLVRPSDVYHGPRYPIHPSSEVLNQGDEFEGPKVQHSFNKPPNFGEYNLQSPKVQYQSVYHKPQIEHHIKQAKQPRKKVKKRPVVYWDDDKKHLLNLIPTPFEEPNKKPTTLRVKKPPKGPYIQRIPDPHDRLKDQYILPDSVSNVGPQGQHAHPQKPQTAEPSFFENLTSMLFGEYPSNNNNNVVYVPVKPRRMRKYPAGHPAAYPGHPELHPGHPGLQYPGAFPGHKRAQPRSSEAMRSRFRARGHVDYFNFE